MCFCSVCDSIRKRAPSVYPAVCTSYKKSGCNFPSSKLTVKEHHQSLKVVRFTTTRARLNGTSELWLRVGTINRQHKVSCLNILFEKMYWYCSEPQFGISKVLLTLLRDLDGQRSPIVNVDGLLFS